MPNPSSNHLLKGVLPALVTPFSKSGDALDLDSMGRLIDHQLECGVTGVVACGSTGEASTLTDSEYVDAVRFTAERVRGKVPCIGGISVSSTARAMQLASTLKELGCDGVLLASPPYNKPPQAGLLEHFRSVKRACGLPIVAYNIPGRTGVAIASQTLATLAREGTIVGVKESSGSVDTVADIISSVGPDCAVVSGEDSLTLAVLVYGGAGVISASANALPKEFVQLYSAFRAGRHDEARNVQMGLMDRIRALFVESNPIPVKSVLAMQKIIAHPTVRLPLTTLSPASLERVKAAFTL